MVDMDKDLIVSFTRSVVEGSGILYLSKLACQSFSLNPNTEYIIVIGASALYATYFKIFL